MSWIRLKMTHVHDLKSPVSDSTVLPGWQDVASSPNSRCCFELGEPGLSSAVPPEGGFVDLNATCSHDSHTLGTGVLACDMAVAAPVAMANRTLFIRSSGSEVVGRLGEVSDVKSGRNGQSTTRHCHLLLLLFSCCRWTLSHKLRILWLVMIDLWFFIQSQFTVDFMIGTNQRLQVWAFLANGDGVWQ